MTATDRILARLRQMIAAYEEAALDAEQTGRPNADRLQATADGLGLAIRIVEEEAKRDGE